MHHRNGFSPFSTILSEICMYVHLRFHYINKIIYILCENSKCRAGKLPKKVEQGDSLYLRIVNTGNCLICGYYVSRESMSISVGFDVVLA